MSICGNFRRICQEVILADVKTLPAVHKPSLTTAHPNYYEKNARFTYAPCCGMAVTTRTPKQVDITQLHTTETGYQ